MKAKRFFLYFLLFLLAIASGVGIAAWRIASIQNSPAFATYGSWRGTRDLPLNRDELVTTQVTLFALFALPSQEAVYLFSASDENGKRLNGDTSYTIIGNINNIKAEYWSITAYGKDLYLIPNDADRFSFNRENLKTDSAGTFVIKVSSVKNEGNWLPVKKGAPFELVLRLYHGQKEYMEHLEQAQLPVIRRAPKL